MKKKSIVWLPFVIAIAIVLGIVIGYRYPQTHTVKGAQQGVPGNKISNLLGIIETQYVDTVDIHGLIEDVMPQIVGELDPHSAYIPAKDLQAVNEELEGSFSGIGIQFSILDDTITVVAVVPGGPSEKIGIMPGRPHRRGRRHGLCRERCCYQRQSPEKTAGSQRQPGKTGCSAFDLTRNADV